MPVVLISVLILVRGSYCLFEQ